MAIYEKAGRDDLATVEREEIAILNEFLPKGLSDAEVEDAIKAAIAKTGAAGGKDMGKVIASLKADYPGRIDFGKASGKVKAALGCSLALWTERSREVSLSQPLACLRSGLSDPEVSLSQPLLAFFVLWTERSREVSLSQPLACLCSGLSDPERYRSANRYWRR